MGRDDRPWEQKGEPDGEVGLNARAAIGGAFLLVNLVVIGIGGLSLATVAIGFAIGAVVVIFLGRLVASSSKSSVRPPEDLLWTRTRGSAAQPLTLRA